MSPLLPPGHAVCALCGRPLAGRPSIATTRGIYVHIHCADRWALTRWGQRRLWATISGLSLALLALWLEAWWVSLHLPPMLLALAGILLHYALNHHWWQYYLWKVRRWMR